MSTFSVTTPVRKWSCLTPSLTSSMSWPQHSTGHCHSSCPLIPRVEGNISTSLHEWSKMHALTDIIITSWPNDIKVVPHPLCPYWQHCETLPLKMALSSMVKFSLFLLWKGREYYNNYTSSIKESPKPSCSCVGVFWPGINKSHWRSCLSMWDLHPVSSPKCCSTPHSYANSIPPMVDVCLRHLNPGRSWLPHMQWRLLKDDPCPTSSIWPEQHHQNHLTAQGDVLRAQNSRDFSLWQWSSIH